MTIATPPPEAPGAQEAAPAEPAVLMPPKIFGWTLSYLVALLALFIIYVTWPSFRSAAPADFGQLPVGVVWFGAIGAVMASLFGIFVHNQKWDHSYDYWYYSRPIFGAVTGSVGALLYLVLLNLGTTNAVKVDRITFYAAAFVFGFADKAFMQILKSVTDVIIKPGGKGS